MTLPPWSHTMLQDLSNCLWKGYRKYVVKDLPKEQKSKEQELGIYVHRAFETAIRACDVSTLPEVYRPLAAPMVAMGAVAELKLGVDEMGQAADFWSARGRGVVDVLIKRPGTALLFDWKTGKVREDPRELMAQSYLLKANYPDIERVQGAYVWLAESRLGEMHNLTNTDRWLNGTKSTLAQAQEAAETGHWRKTRNPLCNYCPVKDCEHYMTWPQRS